MTNKISGIIFYSKNIKDNDLYIKILSSKDEIITGMVYGGNSSKKKLIYQNGYFVNFSISKKSDSFPNIFTAELSKPFIGEIYNDKYKLNALLSILSLINISILEGQIIRGYYKGIYDLCNNIIYKKHWINFYCEWLFYLLKLIGYQIDYKENLNKKYYNINNNTFTNNSSNDSIQFPHEFFLNYEKTNYNNLKLIFTIFESILLKNHLDNISNKMPNNYINFKTLILGRLNR